jgi:succinoglycan biosynthesis protein ExoM
MSTTARIDLITVCICTYKRPLLLEKLITALQHQTTNGLFTYSAVIVDNDCNESARNTVMKLNMNASFAIEYYVVPEQNIAVARNKTIEKAKGGYIAFIDDDEIPPQNWLLTLFMTLNEYMVDGTLGPVEAQYEIQPPNWIVRGKFYEKKPPFETGHVLSWIDTRTSNALIKKEIIGTDMMPFDPRFGRGGEDKDFFKRLIEKGHVFVWCADGVVFESVPPERLTRFFMLKRALLRGKMSIAGGSVQLHGVVKSLLAIVIYSSALPILLLYKHDIFMKYLIKDFDHIGKILAVMGLDVIKQKYVMK